MPFMSFVTRCNNRPEMLAINKQSVQMQTDTDWEHVLIEDAAGRGLLAANCSLQKHRARITGEYVYILDDDNYLVDPDFVAIVNQLDKNQKSSIIIVKCNWLVVLPRVEYWQRPPTQGQIDTLNVVVRNDIWQRHIGAFCQPRYGDFHFIQELFRHGYDTFWLDRIVAGVQQIGSLTRR